VGFFHLFFARNGRAAVPHFHFLVGEAVLTLKGGGKTKKGRQKK